MRGRFRLTDKLQRWLDLKGWSRKKFAAELNTHESTLSEIFSGKRQFTWNMLAKICDLTGLDVGDIVYFDRTGDNGGGCGDGSRV